MSAYYNEHDPFAAAWLRKLIKEGHIAYGDVDERDIRDVQPSDLITYDQCHFFAGIGGWSYALRLVGWPDDRPVWTGSCPCQPFSAAGTRKGGGDDRHLWPHWARLIRECRPVTIFGEQVESAIAHGWLDAVFDDLEREGYDCGAACLPAASVGAPHIRQRLWFVAESDGGHAEHGAIQRGRQHGLRAERGRVDGSTGDAERAESVVADHDDTGRGEQRGRELLDGERTAQRYDADGCGADGVGDAEQHGLQRRSVEALQRAWRANEGATVGLASGSPWANADWLPCRDGKARPVEPGTFPLAHGVSARVGRLRGYGNAIVPQVAAEVVSAFMELHQGDML